MAACRTRWGVVINTVLFGGALVGLAAGCSGRSEPRSLPPQTLVEEATPEAEPEAPPPEPVEEAPAAPETLIVLEEADPVAKAPTLVEAAEAERVRRAHASRPSLQLTDKNLGEHAVGDLTTSAPDSPSTRKISISGPAPSENAEQSAEETASAVADDTTDTPSGIDTTTDEGYWRNRVLDLRLRWRSAFDSIRELEGQTAKLRNDFYAADDPYYRDTQIKPTWDRAIENLETARADVERYQIELRSALNEGRRGGALPGWLREGVEHEPPTGQPPEDKIDPDQYSVQPTIYEEGGTR